MAVDRVMKVVVLAGHLDVWVRAVQSGSGSVRGAVVRLWSVMELEVAPAAASWGGRTLCRICGEGMTAWAEPGPESECWAFCIKSETLKRGKIIYHGDYQDFCNKFVAT